MLFLFFLLFFVLSIFLFFVGVYLLDCGSLVFEVLLPCYLLSDFSLSFLVDYVSLFFFSAVSLISSVVFLYSKFYMADQFEDLSLLRSRFFFLLFLFVASMFFLVFSSSWLMVMLGWDGLGLVSFLLVIFYNNSSSLDSGLITVFTNRLGDCFFIVSFMSMFYSGWVTFEFLSYESCLLFSIFIVLGAITKSAQVPFSSWLPAAMAAPTPVSSLVHSSTLVTAGVYLLVRFNFLLSSFYFFLIPISLLTMFLGGLSAICELDFKKVVAMSTLSQLGFMIFSISSGFWLLGFLHMIFHAFFKSSLFLSTGNLMHFLFSDQDSRNFGSMGISVFSKLIFSMSVLSLMGFPFSLGFYSKDSILGLMGFNLFSFNVFVFLVACCFTVSYSIRLLYVGFLNFSSFSNSLVFLEDKFFYLPIFFLYSFCVGLGNFFFFYFLPPMVFSLIDFAGGVFIIALGVFFFFISLNYYFSLNILSSITFLSVISSSVFSKLSQNLEFKAENSWGEVFSGKGLDKSLIFIKMYGLRLYAFYFTHLVVLTGVILVMWY